MTGRFIGAVNPGEKGDQGASAFSTSAMTSALAGAGEQCTVQAAVFQIFPGGIDGGRRPDDGLGFPDSAGVSPRNTLGQRGFAALAGSD